MESEVVFQAKTQAKTFSMELPPWLPLAVGASSRNPGSMSIFLTIPEQRVSDRQLRGQGSEAGGAPGEDILPERVLQLSGEEGGQDSRRARPRRRRRQDGGAGGTLGLRQVHVHPADTEVLRPRSRPGRQISSI